MKHPQSCPFLGIHDDPLTRSASESIPNYCHKIQPARRVRRDYQQTLCLQDGFAACPIIAQKGRIQHRKYPQVFPHENQTRPMLMGIGLALIAVLLISAFVFRSAWIPVLENISMPGILPTTPTTNYKSISVRTPAMALTQTAFARQPSLTPKIIPTIRVTLPVATASPAATVTVETATTTPGPQLETPFGPAERQYLVYQVKAGDNMVLLAERFHTSQAVIVALNDFSTTSVVWAGRYLVIAPGCTDTNGLKMLSPAYLDGDIRIEELVEKFHVSAGTLQALNGISGELVTGHRWIVIPTVP
jgi:LysM repeat protein